MPGPLSALVVLAVLLLIGAPIALSIPGTRPEWTGIAFESVIVGVVVEMFVAMVLLHPGWYHAWSVLALTVLIVGSATFAMRRFGGPPADLSQLRGLEPMLIGLGALTCVVLALAIRHAPSYYIFETSDMGSYINTANALKNTGSSYYGWQPQGLTLFLRETKLLLGQANTVAGLPALGATLLLGAIAITRALRLHIVTTVALALVLLVHPVAVWFSLFPASESLNAVLLLALVYFVIRMRMTQSTGHAVIGGLVAGALLVVRGEAMLLAPVLVVLLLASTAVDEEPVARVQKRFTLVALVALLSAYAYDVTYAHPYFRAQIGHLVPDAVSRTIERARLEQFSVPLVLAGVLALGAVLGLVKLVEAFVRPRLVGRDVLFWRCTYLALLALTAVLAVVVSLQGMRLAVGRWGVVLIVLVVIGTIGVIARPGRYLDGASGLLLLTVMSLFGILFARRTARPMTAPTYIYWDRYLFSEVLPAAITFAAIGIQIGVETALRAPVRVARYALAALVVVIGLALIPQMRETRRVTEHRLFGNSYDTLDRLDQLTRSDGRKGIVVYSGAKTRPPQWYWSNTYRAFALPLTESFGRVVYGIDPNSALAPDQVYTPDEARAVLQRRNASSGYLVRLRPPGGTRLADDEHTKWVGSVAYRAPQLEQVATGPAAPWTFTDLRFDVYALS